MRKLRVFAFVVLAFTGFALYPTMLSAQATAQQWSSREMTVRENPQSSSVYFMGNDFGRSSCFIWVRRDGIGIVIVAKDAHYVDPDNHGRWELGETVRITKTDSGVQVARSYGESRMVVDRFGGVRGYDIFDKHYKEAAKDLPPEIQKLFYGEYGIGEKP